MFIRKPEVIKWNDFFVKKEDVLNPPSVLLLAATSAYLFNAEMAEAAGLSDRIIRAFDPIIELVKGISYPVCFLMISGSFILIILGQKSKGLQMLKWASVGYIGLQFAPAIMQILVEVGKAMAGK